MSDNDTSQEDVTEYYPDGVSELIDRLAQQRFEQQSAKYGPGKNWLGCEVGEMAQQAQQKLQEAEKLADSGDGEAALIALADAINYIRFEGDNILESGEVEKFASEGGD